jgi:hypothetical protein
MLTVTISRPLHDACEGACLLAKTYRGFLSRVKTAHPEQYEQATNRAPVSSPYIDLRERLGDGPKRVPNPDAVPMRRRRRLPYGDWRELERRRRLAKFIARWDLDRRFDQGTISATAYCALLDDFEAIWDENGRQLPPLSLLGVEAA